MSEPPAKKQRPISRREVDCLVQYYEHNTAAIKGVINSKFNNTVTCKEKKQDWRKDMSQDEQYHPMLAHWGRGTEEMERPQGPSQKES